MKPFVIFYDYFDEHGFFSNEDPIHLLKDSLMKGAKYCCDCLSLDTNSIIIDPYSYGATVYFGNMEIDGFNISISAYNKDETDRMIISVGKNLSGKSIYIETREQYIFDNFINKDPEILNWIEDSLEILERKFNS